MRTERRATRTEVDLLFMWGKGSTMRFVRIWLGILAPLLTFALFTFAFGPVAAVQQLVGHVYGGGHPVAQSTVTLWAAGQAAPTKLSETQTKDDGAFSLKFDARNAGSDVLYLIATGGETRIGDSPG